MAYRPLLLGLRCARRRRRAADPLALILIFLGIFAPRGAAGAPAPGSSCPPPRVLFLNFGGAMLTGVCEDATHNCSENVLPDTLVHYPALVATPEQIQEITNDVKGYYRPYNVEVVTSRPASGHYEMVMVGGAPSDIGDAFPRSTGISAVDCGNKVDTDVSFAYQNDLSNDGSTHLLAVTITHESGHAFGLAHVTDDTDVMFAGNGNRVVGFHDTNLEVSPNAVNCEQQPMQNDHQVLEANIGPSCAAEMPNATGCTFVRSVSEGPSAGPLLLGVALLAAFAWALRRE